MATKVRASHFRLKMNSVFKESRRGNCNKALPLLSASMGVHVFIDQCPKIVANFSSFVNAWFCKACHVRKRILYELASIKLAFAR